MSKAVGLGRGRDVAGLAVSLLACFAVAALGTYFSMLGLARWYGTLRKPAWTPPNAIFGPVWTTLYVAMAVAAWLAWRTRPAGAGRALAWFGLQLAFNLAWSGLFFGLRAPGPAFLDITLLWLAILATLASFWRIDRGAGALMVPYLLWVTFAAGLNLAIWRLNS